MGMKSYVASQTIWWLYCNAESRLKSAPLPSMQNQSYIRIISAQQLQPQFLLAIYVVE